MTTDHEPSEGGEKGPWYTSVHFIAAVSTLLLTILLLIIYRRMVYILWKTFPRDSRAVIRYIRVMRTLRIFRSKNMTASKSFDEVVAKYPNKVCFYFEDQEWTFRQMGDYVNRIANYFQSQGYRKGDNVALFMENRPEFVCTWLGLSKLGVVPALINYNLRLKPLLHSFEIVNSKAIIYGYELSEALQELKDNGSLPNIPLYCSGHAGKQILVEKSVDLDEAVKRNLGTNPVVKEEVGFNDNLVYIYTSGTTGLPKAAIIKNARYFMCAVGGHFMHDMKENDIQYTALPLYHTAGGLLGAGQAITYGTTIVLRRKFSASSFWKDCIKHKATVAQYIGEICRYLHSQPPAPEDRQHRVERIYGNGLRPEIWQSFVDRFGIKHVNELYGSTEGNCNFINIDSKVGSVGFLPRAAYAILPTALVQVDDETNEIIRHPKTNRVIPCKPNQPGELIGKIISTNPLRDFQGYAGGEREKKIIRDAFRKGDAWFRTGDLLSMDEFGYFYFKDRTGDTFRWKGENCSTAEVEAVISNVCGLLDAVAYGVEIPGNEGRAGMAAIADPDETVDLDTLATELSKNLPPYARPLFIRTMKEVELTGTYKLKKVELQREGFDINKIKDKIYFFHNSKFVLVDSELYKKLMAGQMRL